MEYYITRFLRIYQSGPNLSVYIKKKKNFSTPFSYSCISEKNILMEVEICNRRSLADDEEIKSVKEIWKRKSTLNYLPGNSRGKPHIGKEMVSAIIPLKRKPIHQAPTNFASPDFIPILEVKTKIESSLRHYLPFYLNKINFFK